MLDALATTLQSKSIDWFLYDRDLRYERVNRYILEQMLKTVEERKGSKKWGKDGIAYKMQEDKGHSQNSRLFLR